MEPPSSRLHLSPILETEGCILLSSCASISLSGGKVQREWLLRNLLGLISRIWFLLFGTGRTVAGIGVLPAPSDLDPAPLPSFPLLVYAFQCLLLLFLNSETGSCKEVLTSLELPM